MPRLSLAALAFALTCTTAAAQQTPVSVALDWTPNTNHVGLFVARDLGFYEQAGLDVTILPFADTATGTLLANRVADFAILGALGLFTQRTAGADLVGTFALVQSETGRLVFDANREDIQSPADLDGLLYGGFGSDWENALIGSMIRHDGGVGEFETVTLGTGVYEALANGAIDFTLEVATWEGVRSELIGRDQRAFRYADYGVPDQHTHFIGTTESYLAEQPETAAAFVAATLEGYEWAVDNPEEAADLLIAANPDALTDREFIVASMNALVDYFATPEGEVGPIDPEKVEAMGAFLYEAGVLRDENGEIVSEKPDFSTYYTTRFIDGTR